MKQASFAPLFKKRKKVSEERIYLQAHECNKGGNCRLEDSYPTVPPTQGVKAQPTTKE